MQSLNGLLDQRNPVRQWDSRHLGEFEPEVAIGLPVQLLKIEGVFETDLPGLGRLDRALVIG
jgi:hypothetical protein